ncbi:MAG: aldehyde dehydrogenase family protein, partial [Gammaproteobacteria bacterium]|nr:aldehyde dehydrogenase family protein [Gammaproteobacteria bacterium]
MKTFEPKILIGGDFSTQTDLDRIPVINPCNEEVLWETPTCDGRHVAQALAHARAALKTWGATHGWERGKVLRAIARRMEARKDDLAMTLSLEIGRPLGQSEG